MPTPAQHIATAEALLADAVRPNRITSGTDWLMISAHAALGRTAGTGSHYASAEAALDQAQAHRGDLGSNYGYASQVQLGLVHAQLADPA